jgi:hypothetical protein
VKQENRDGPKYHTDGSKFCRANSPVQLLRARFSNKIDKTYNTTAPSGNGSLAACLHVIGTNHGVEGSPQKSEL